MILDRILSMNDNNYKQLLYKRILLALNLKIKGVQKIL